MYLELSRIANATVWQCILLLCRILVLKEPFLDFQDHEKLWFYLSYPLLMLQDLNANEEYQQEHGGVAGLFYQINVEQYRKSWSSFYRDNKVATGHIITKQWRHQSYHDSEDHGGDPTSVQKLAGWRHTIVRETRKPKRAKLQRRVSQSATIE